jgi:hypothetical protein
MLPPLYQNMANLIASFSIKKCPSTFMNVMIGKHCACVLDIQIFGHGNVYYSNSIIITNSCKLSFPIVGFKMSSLPTLALKSPKKIHMEFIE